MVLYKINYLMFYFFLSFYKAIDYAGFHLFSIDSGSNIGWSPSGLPIIVPFHIHWLLCWNSMLVVLITRDMFIRLECRLIEHMSYHDCYLNKSMRRLSLQLYKEMTCPLCLGYAPRCICSYFTSYCYCSMFYII
jgi:hypothetical protein